MSLIELATKRDLAIGVVLPEESEVRTGSPLPIGGAHQYGDGVNFVLFSRHATSVRLELYENAGDSCPIKIIQLDPARHRTGDIWHVWVRGIPVGQLYGYRIEGPYEPEEGHRFNPHRLLLDPFAKAISGIENWDFSAAHGYDSSSALADLSISTVDDAGSMPKCIFTSDNFDWETDTPPKHSAADTVIYEMHVRGFTIDPSSRVAQPGTFHALTQKIPYLQDLGVTAVELMPIPNSTKTNRSGSTRLPGRNSGIIGATIRLHTLLRSSRTAWEERPAADLEFREMVKAFHCAGIEVILDIVLNHTAEGDELGPTICLRGIENSIFYMLQENDSGTTRTLPA